MLSGQAPKGIKYQTVVRDAAGALISNQQVNITLSILQGSTTVCTETFTPTTNEFGLVNLEIGSVNPTAFAAINWMNGTYFTKVELNGTVMGTSQLLSVPYALYAENSSNSLWNANGSSLYYNGGNVGIGIDNPIEKLHIKSGSGSRPRIILENSQGNQWFINAFGSNNKFSIGRINGADDFVIDSLGHVGIGITTPAITSRLHIRSSAGSWGGPRLLIENSNPATDQVALGFKSSGVYDWEFAGYHTGKFALRDVKNGVTKILITPGASGTVAIPILEITGGSDLAEPFPIVESLQVGSVVIIDENNPGHLIESTQPYDKRVAGVVSGAGGIKPGLTLKQEGIMEGNQDIALTGRVYVLATAVNGAIKPGDRLTTSIIAGHAMKATNNKKCDGSVIGKAMSSLEDGEGLVLVLVNLQ
ncbi:MAG: hypothetical protein CVU43_21860 [Chloroflexi bacterium HGW-Chloroflexi-5]|nr:MAG: hypothetical protein CVU43_21860 [Chloroflexi bacterium HGW-Chloroflexi-5]